MDKYKIAKVATILIAIIWIPLAVSTTFMVAYNSWFRNELPNTGSIFTDTAENIDWINNNYSESVPMETSFIESYGFMQRYAGRSYIKDNAAPDRSIVKDQDGNLFFTGYWYMPNSFDGDPLMKQLNDYKDYLAKYNIPVLYAAMPEKIIAGYTKLPKTINNYSNANVDSIIKLCDKYDIENIDFRKYITENAKNKTNLFYKTDHHWTTPTAFKGFSYLVHFLNEYYDLNIDPDQYYRNMDNYNVSIEHNDFVGSQGKRIGKYYTDMDKFIYISPNFNTDFTLQSSTLGDMVLSGSYEEVLIDQNYLQNQQNYTNYYNSYLGGDAAKIHIINNNVDNRIKVLIIKDSFTNPLATFLASTVYEVKLVDMRLFTGDLYKETVNYNPDVTIIAYSSGSLVKDMFHFNTTMDNDLIKDIPDDKYGPIPQKE